MTYINNISPLFAINIYFNGSSYFSGTTWYAAGEIRWASITDNTTSLTINAWSPSDASQAIQQHTHHLKDAHSGIRDLEKICICVPSTGVEENSSGFIDCWGDPAEQLLSPQSWSELLIEMSRQWKIKAEKLEVKWVKTCTISVKGLLDALLLADSQNPLNELLVKQKGGWREVSIYNDTINIRDVLEWSSQHKSQLRVAKVTFLDLNCSIYPCDKALMRQSSSTHW